jgi:hypothetical protein
LTCLLRAQLYDDTRFLILLLYILVTFGLRCEGKCARRCEKGQNLAKLDDGLAESPTVMVVDKTKNKKQFLAKIGAYLNPVGLSSRPKGSEII